MKGEVVLVRFLFDDLSATKVRPAVCLTDPIGAHEHVVLAFVSSQLPADILKTDVVLGHTGVDFALTGLRVSSTLRLHRLVTLSTAVLQRELGELSPVRQVEVDAKLKLLFDLKP